MRFAFAFTRVAATVSCCAILAPDGAPPVLVMVSMDAPEVSASRADTRRVCFWPIVQNSLLRCESAPIKSA